jgi:hypothetical protein
MNDKFFHRKETASFLLAVLIIGLLPGCCRQSILSNIRPLNEKTSDIYQWQNDVMVCIKKMVNNDIITLFGKQCDISPRIQPLQISIFNKTEDVIVLTKDSLQLPIISQNEVFNNCSISKKTRIKKMPSSSLSVRALLTGGLVFCWMLLIVTISHGFTPSLLGYSSAVLIASISGIVGYYAVFIDSWSPIYFIDYTIELTEKWSAKQRLKQFIKKYSIDETSLKIPPQSSISFLVFVKQEILPQSFSLNILTTQDNQLLTFNFTLDR